MGLRLRLIVHNEKIMKFILHKIENKMMCQNEFNLAKENGKRWDRGGRICGGGVQIFVFEMYGTENIYFLNLL